MFEGGKRDFEIIPRPDEMKTIRKAEKLIEQAGPWAEELRRGLGAVEESKTLSISSFNFAMSVLASTVQDATFVEKNKKEAQL